MTHADGAGSPSHFPDLERLLQEAREDPGTLGIILHGSHGAGTGDEDSDYDLIWVLTDDTFGREGTRNQYRRTEYRHGRKLIEAEPSSPSTLSTGSMEPWEIQGLAAASILLDKTGEVTVALDTLLAIPAEEARTRAADSSTATSTVSIAR